MVSSIKELLISWEFHTKQSLEFTQNDVKNKNIGEMTNGLCMETSCR